MAWLRSPENDRAPGNTTIKGCQHLESGVPWTDSGLLESKSCGAIMRVAPIGLYYHSDPSELRLAAWASSLVTHAHPTALVSAEVTAFCVSWAVAGVPPSEYWDRIKSSATRLRAGMGARLGKKLEDDPDTPARRITWRKAGRSCCSSSTRFPWQWRRTRLTSATFWVVAGVPTKHSPARLPASFGFRNDYAEAIKRGANTGGDSDSIASIAGAISGAYLGHNAVPKDWRKRIESRQLLIDLSKQLCQRHAR